MIVRRPARPALLPFVELFWSADDGDAVPSRLRREAILPTGTAHIAVRLTDEPIHFLANADDVVGHALRGAVVCGVRSQSYFKALPGDAPTVGAQFRSGAAALLLGMPAHHFAERHLPLEHFWGSAAASQLRERLAEQRNATARIDVFEAILAARLPRIRGLHPAIAAALPQLHAARNVGHVAEQTGYSHRHFDRLFTEAVGLRPKLYCRVARFARALERLTAEPEASWADVAAGAGYADQPHFNREFRAFAGLSPSRYRALAAGSGRHVPL